MSGGGSSSGGSGGSSVPVEEKKVETAPLYEKAPTPGNVTQQQKNAEQNALLVAQRGSPAQATALSNKYGYGTDYLAQYNARAQQLRSERASTGSVYGMSRDEYLAATRPQAGERLVETSEGEVIPESQFRRGAIGGTPSGYRPVVDETGLGVSYEFVRYNEDTPVQVGVGEPVGYEVEGGRAGAGVSVRADKLEEYAEKPVVNPVTGEVTRPTQVVKPVYASYETITFGEYKERVTREASASGFNASFNISGQDLNVALEPVEFASAEFLGLPSQAQEKVRTLRYLEGAAPEQAEVFAGVLSKKATGVFGSPTAFGFTGVDFKADAGAAAATGYLARLAPTQSIYTVYLPDVLGNWEKGSVFTTTSKEEAEGKFSQYSASIDAFKQGIGVNLMRSGPLMEASSYAATLTGPMGFDFLGSTIGQFVGGKNPQEVRNDYFYSLEQRGLLGAPAEQVLPALTVDFAGSPSGTVASSVLGGAVLGQTTKLLSGTGALTRVLGGAAAGGLVTAGVEQVTTGKASPEGALFGAATGGLFTGALPAMAGFAKTNPNLLKGVVFGSAGLTAASQAISPIEIPFITSPGEPGAYFSVLNRGGSEKEATTRALGTAFGGAVGAASFIYGFEKGTKGPLDYEKVNIPTATGEKTALSALTYGENTKILVGKGANGLFLGEPAPEQLSIFKEFKAPNLPTSAEAALDTEGYNIYGKLSSKLFATETVQRNIRATPQYTEAIKTLETVGKPLEYAEPYYASGELPTVKALGETGTVAAKNYLQTNKKFIQKIYGSSTGESFFPTATETNARAQTALKAGIPERIMPGDIDAQLKPGTSIFTGEWFAEGAVNALEKAGLTSARKNLLVVAVDPEGVLRHAIDIHLNEQPSASSGSIFDQGTRFGLNIDQPTVKISGLPASSLSEQAAKKFSAASQLYTAPGGGTTAEPQLHRVKDIVGGYRSYLNLLESQRLTGQITSEQYALARGQLEKYALMPRTTPAYEKAYRTQLIATLSGKATPELAPLTSPGATIKLTSQAAAASTGLASYSVLSRGAEYQRSPSSRYSISAAASPSLGIASRSAIRYSLASPSILSPSASARSLSTSPRVYARPSTSPSLSGVSRALYLTPSRTVSPLKSFTSAPSALPSLPSRPVGYRASPSRYSVGYSPSPLPVYRIIPPRPVFSAKLSSGSRVSTRYSSKNILKQAARGYSRVLAPYADWRSKNITELKTGRVATSPSEETSRKYWFRSFGQEVPTAEMLGKRTKKMFNGKFNSTRGRKK